jgi:hypothetical protein
MPSPLPSPSITPCIGVCSIAPIHPRPMEASLRAWQPGRFHRRQICFVTDPYRRNVDASDRRLRCNRAGAGSASATGVSLSLRQRCAPGAAGVSPKRRPVCGQHAASTLLWGASPVRGATLRCLSDVGASVPPIMRTGTIATPRLHPADIRQDESREVRPGRMAEKRGDIIVLARCAFWHRNVRFQETSAKSTGAAHLTNSTPANRKLACDRVRLGYSVCCGRSG